MDKTLTTAELATLHALRSVDLKIAELSDARNHLKTQLIDALGEADTATDPDTGKSLFTYRASRQFNAQRAATMLTADQLSQCLPDELDPKKVKAKLTQEQLDACMEYAGSRRFVLAK